MSVLNSQPICLKYVFVSVDRKLEAVAEPSRSADAKHTNQQDGKSTKMGGRTNTNDASGDRSQQKQITSNNNNNNSSSQEMQEELKQVLTLFREKRRTLDIVKTPEIFIQQSSSTNEVKKWLRAKGFSENVLRKLNGLNGNELFLLTRETLEEYCGLDEGRRLASQITIQRNVSGVNILIHLSNVFNMSCPLV